MAPTLPKPSALAASARLRSGRQALEQIERRLADNLRRAIGILGVAPLAAAIRS